MDGVPGISFPGIKARSTFIYEFPIIQSGTYWYHSHSGEQEQGGLYGPIVIDPAGADPFAFDREHVIVLSDHSQMTGEQIFREAEADGRRLFQLSAADPRGLARGSRHAAQGPDRVGKDADGPRRHRRRHRLDLCLTWSTATGRCDNWTGLFKPGERVRLRIINAAAQTNFNVRIPDLPMTVVHRPMGRMSVR